MIRPTWSFIGTSGGIAAAIGAGLLWPDWPRLASDVRAPHTAVAAHGADGVIADLTTGVLWFISIWVLCGLAASLLGSVPGTVGWLASGLARRMLPAAVIRLVGGAAGLSVALAAPAAAATDAPTSPSPVPATAAVSIGWPTDGPAPPVSSSPRVPSQSLSGEPAGQRPPSRKRPPPHSPKSDPVTVAPGDSLWAIAARALEADAARAAKVPPSTAQIAATWPRWYARNRTVVGPDPSLIRPGQVLQPPG